MDAGVVGVDELARILTEVRSSIDKTISEQIMYAIAGQYVVDAFVEVEMGKAPIVTFFDRSGYEIKAFMHIGVSPVDRDRPGISILSDANYRFFHALKLAHDAILSIIYPDYLEQNLRVFGTVDYTGPKHVDIPHNGGEIHIERNGEGAMVIRTITYVIVIDTMYETLLEHTMRTTRYPTFYYKFRIDVHNVELMEDYPDWYIEIEQQ